MSRGRPAPPAAIRPARAGAGALAVGRWPGEVLARLGAMAAGVDRLALLFVAVGVALRVAWVLNAHVAAVDDAAFYYQHARDLVSGSGYVSPATGHASAFLPPGYSLLLAFLFLFTGPSLIAGAFLNVILAAATMLFTYLLARHFFGTGPARVAVLVMALFPSQIVYTPALVPDTAFTAAVMAALWAALAAGRSSTRGRYLAAGAFAGFAILIAPKALLLLPVLALAFKMGRSWRAAARPAALMALATIAVVAPWTARNLVQMRAVVPVSTNEGVNLWIGNNPQATGGWMSWDGTSSWSYPPDELATNHERQHEAIAYAVEHPLATVQLWPDKLRLAFDQDYDYLRHFSVGQRDSPLPHWLPLDRLTTMVNAYYHLALRAGLAGIIVIALSRRRAWALLASLGLLALPIVIFFGMDRYHVPLLPLLAIFAAGGAWELARLFGQYRLATDAGERVSWRPVPDC